MNEVHDHYANAKNLAIDILRKESNRTPELVMETAKKAAMAAAVFAKEPIDVDALNSELRHLFSIAVDKATSLDDPSEHIAWLHGRKSSIRWRFWNRYMTYLERDFGMSPTVVNGLHDLTDMILERIEDPQREGRWERKGMVVGSVQSGKTANYIGLICKAIDAGYKLVVVLAGLHSNLRSQTQLRVDEGVLGFDTQKSRRLNKDSRWIGVGRLPGERPAIHSLTSSAEDGDFNKTIANQANVMLGSDPVVLVVKKNSGVLKNLLESWVLPIAGAQKGDGSAGQVIRNVPLLLIDDEADNASVNTKEKRDPAQNGEETASAINQRIRTILLAFEKSAYVGYTATPFANIFINPQAKTEKLGRDIFPSSFIINVKPPSNYVGPAKVFGLNGDPDAGIAEAPGLPIVRKIDDYEEAFPPKHKRDHVPPYLPESLRRAVRCFVLACAARQARGQLRKHSSMLVHVTRFVEVQGHVVELVKEELRGLQRRLEFGDGSRKPPLRDELRDLWLTEFETTSSEMPEDAGPRVAWELVEPELFPAASKIAVLAINGYAKTALDYKEHEAEGRYVIAVGGDKLSRGLTLEGLCVSYFLRTSKMYDTLMQMGRWFGYRPGYLDLCRLFTTEQLVRWYRHIALAEIELRREFDYMVAAGLTPEKYGLRVRSHPDGMIVTALNKMCHSETLELSWAGVLVQTTQLPKDQARVAANVRVTESLLAALSDGKQESAKRTVSWTSVSGEHVAKYVESLQLPKESARADGAQLAAFIRKQMSLAVPELTGWTVALIGSSTGRASTQAIGGFTVGLVERTPDATPGGKDAFALRKANIISPSDQAVDLEHVPVTPELLDALCEKPGLEPEIRQLPPVSTLYELAVELTRLRIQAGKLKGSNPEPPNGRVVREVRPKQHGLLLIYPLDASKVQGAADPDMPIIGVALSFPTSDSALGIEYVVNKVWGAEIEEDAAYDD